MLEFFQYVFPTTKGYKLPPSYYVIKKTFKMIGLGYESIHACVNDCFLFRGDNNKDVHFCSVCKMSRWKDSNTSGKKVPKKVLRYFSIIPRLQRLYKSSHTAKEMTWHATGKCTEPGKMQHPIDGRAWKNFDTKSPHKWRRSLEFNGEIENGDPPRKFDRDQIQAQLARLPTRVKAKHPSYGAKPEGSIAEGYVTEEALTFSSHSFWDVTMKFNQPDRNVDPPTTCQFQVFRSLYKSIGLRSVIRFDAQELKKVIWYVLHNSPEIDTYRSQFKSATGKLFALAFGPTSTSISVNSYVVNGARFVMHSRDERRTTQNNGICSPGGKDGEMYYGQLQEILEFSYLSFKVVLFRVKWFDTSNKGRKVKHLVLRNSMTQILTKGKAFRDDQYILATQVKQCFYLEDMARRQPHWKDVEHVNHKKFSDGGVIVVEEDHDVIHFDNSSDLPLSTSLNDLDNATLHIDGQSTEVDALPDIIDLDEDDDISDAEDAIPRDLADSDDEDLVNVDDDGVEVVYSSKEKD
nr:hypothetical protein [Tanacetum cinerariifolium]